MKKRLFSIITILALCLALLSATALAASDPDKYVFDISEGGVTIMDGTESGKIKVEYGSSQTTTADIDPSQVITVTGSYTGTVDYKSAHNLVVQTSTPVTIKASNLTINNTNAQYAYAMALEAANANVKLILEGDNYFAGGKDKAGIAVGTGNTLTIEGNGSVEAKGGSGIGGAGIGGDGDRDCGTIIINSGTVTATGNGGAADIGGGSGATGNGTLSGAGYAVINASNVKANTDGFNGTINGVSYGVVKYGVTVNDVEVTSSNKADVLDNGKVSYDPDANVLSVNELQGGDLTVSGNGSTDVVISGTSSAPAVGTLTVTDAKNVTVTASYSGGPAISGAANITCTGDVEIVNQGTGMASYGLTVTSAKDVTVTASCDNPAIGGAANITCTGDVAITNSGSDNGYGMAVGSSLTVTSAKDVTVTANSSSPAISSTANITCTGDVEIVNQGTGMASYGLTVNGAKDVTVTTNCSGPAIGGTATINCSGDVTISNDNGMAVGSTLTVSNAANVTVTANSSSPAISGAANITCTGDVAITNSGSGMAVSSTLTVNGATNVTVSANSTSPAIGGSTEFGASINCSGDVEIKNSGSGMAVSSTLTVSNAANVTVTANSSNPAIGGDYSAGIGANINCSGDVTISNDNGMAVGSKLTVTGATNVTVTANNSGPAIGGAAEITCTGNVTISNTDGFCVASKLVVNGAADVTVTANNSGGPAIAGDPSAEIGAIISCSGDVRLTNASGFVVGNKLTISSAQNVTVTANSSGAPALTRTADITCSGDVEIVNTSGMAVGNEFTYNKSGDSHGYVVKTGADPESLAIHAEKAAGETFGPEPLGSTVHAVKIETVHTPGAWEYDSTQHWRNCTVCGEALDKAEHTFSGNTCTECGYTKPSSGGSSAPTYPPVVIQPDEGGSVTVSPKSPEKGDTVTITPAPADGYEVTGVTVTDKNGDPVAVKDNGDGTYSFTQPAGKVTVEVQFAEAVCDGGADCPAYHFADVNTDAWYHEAVDYVIENGIMNGIGNDQFAPNSTLQRSMLTTMLARMDGVDTDGGATWYEKGMQWAVANGISDGTNPDSNITREQIAAMLYRYAQLKGYDTSERGSLDAFGDGAKTSSWAVESMQWAVGSGLLQGSNGMLNPTGNATRAEVAQMLLNFCENIAK